MRKISNEELADLPNNWNNPTVDISKYYQNVMYAFEVSKEVYDKYYVDGGLCQTYKGKFYIA
jgi:hypothetical protein